MKHIRKKSIAPLKSATGSISDTTNIQDKRTNTYSARIIDTKIASAGGLNINSNRPIGMNKVIFIGDSYGGLTGQNTWVDILINKLDLSEEEYCRKTEGSTGFASQNSTSNNRFINLLQNAFAEVSTNANDFTHIIVGGGANDMRYTTSELMNYISSFITYANANFINAKVYIAQIGFTIDINYKEKLGNVLEAYSRCKEYGAVFLKGVENAIHYYPYFLTNGEYVTSNTVHPTQEGSTAIGNAMYEALMSGQSNTFRNWEVLSDNISYGNLYSYCNNGIYKLRLSEHFKISKSVASFKCSRDNPIDIMEFSGGCVGGNNASKFRFPYTVVTESSGAVMDNINGYLTTESFIRDDKILQKLVFYPYHINTSSTGEGGYKKITNLSRIFFTPVELTLGIYDC